MYIPFFKESDMAIVVGGGRSTVLRLDVLRQRKESLGLFKYTVDLCKGQVS